MRILMLTPYLPYPLWSGGQIRTFNLLKNLAEKHQITLFSFIRQDSEKQNIPILKKYCDEVKVFVKRPPWSITSLLLSGITYYPLVVCMYLNNELKKNIAEAIDRKHFDLIHAETFYVMPNIPQYDIPIFLAEQTIEYLVYDHHTQNVNFMPKKMLMDWDVFKIRFWEKRFWKKAEKVIAMSESDKTLMKKMLPDLSVDIVPNGVDTQFFSFNKKHSPHKVKTVLFVGNFKWLQNREAAAFLLDKVWPVIFKKLGDNVRLWIVGKHPPPQIRKKTPKNVTVSDDIDDIRYAYYRSDLLLAPIYGPGGTRYKILESMAAGVPVVTTSTGIEGLSAVNFRHAVISDSARGLADSSIKVLTDPKLYNRLAENGRHLVEQDYSWKKIAGKLDLIYQKAVAGRI
ncbi:hypothetical protein A3D05_04880 [Candidatus Gottesmanbacteria bacterium RIFCSPHIGHO2_02_FULL_40_24]|uniref:Glycosyltransferase subfamily 4-like N-terminal domain-containing protein n=1 Tax=Candidatus Gottesmanbacteria bacterium RIFCSPHIGHO2_01_FULL_40_15 TaxID=1798376 RepID=A0A1F5Z250_9BACT|nr:MAG: hypothetical protein A2777_05910 [Candidatus Gottesmanbacteria bacterium RIFCSPHIGHO2_01_FULL_40_15]OGG16205.1 MAG: hypothetical protein A3D05_04880 [Candidatus Gottesmanbacteria bacterium RIFCSPHIGHO2_02_FULL_40_24]OGG23199.1 MAG: hypothetical protein A3B48_00260 [Candidatus Gottesmanbacteria bacterium RIFCSPLOWO2_01_FULL_40_10]OGG25873.1 MAG: hypothetical protein A3E42_06155 [Candidatus Gottesmanbacteria bacterium RIFCSPHIGHO2_12_FULL_40_13]OGG31767.1 MAG: hypothetical protein A3I80_0